jgi:glycerol-3-phosphate dehydrogenase subunit C
MNHEAQSADKCIACSSCTVCCPVAEATREYVGPKMAGPVMDRFRRPGQQNDVTFEYCSNCKNCDITCPSGVSVSTLNMLAKNEYYKTHRHTVQDWLLSHIETLAKIASPIAALANLGRDNPLSALILEKLGVVTSMPMPKFASRTFLQEFKRLKQQSYPDKVVFFPGCFISYNAPQVGLDLVAVMQANRHEVIVPDSFKCCGSPLVVNGYMDDARKNAEHNLKELKKWTDQGYPIITCCTSCGLMIKQEYQELFEIPGNKEVAAKIYDAQEYLLELMDAGKLNTAFSPVEGRYLYHAPCHLRVQGMGRPAVELLRLVPKLEIVEANAGCCGLSGNYGFKTDKLPIA